MPPPYWRHRHPDVGSYPNVGGSNWVDYIDYTSESRS